MQKNEVVMSIFKDFHLHIVPHMKVDSSDSITDCKTDVSLDTLETVNMKVSHCSLSEYAEICQSRYTGDSQYEGKSL
jgi:hypothetical protein